MEGQAAGPLRFRELETILVAGKRDPRLRSHEAARLSRCASDRRRNPCSGMDPPAKERGFRIDRRASPRCRRGGLGIVKALNETFLPSGDTVVTQNEDGRFNLSVGRTPFHPCSYTGTRA